jgi:hypothetical protein
MLPVLAQRAALVAVAGVLVVVGILFLALASYIALSRSMESEAAAAIVGGGAILLGVALVLATRLARRAPPPFVDQRRGRGDLPPEALAGLVRAIGSSPKEAAAIALVAGVVAGVSPDLFRNAARLLDD